MTEIETHLLQAFEQQQNDLEKFQETYKKQYESLQTQLLKVAQLVGQTKSPQNSTEPKPDLAEGQSLCQFCKQGYRRKIMDSYRGQAGWDANYTCLITHKENKDLVLECTHFEPHAESVGA